LKEDEQNIENRFSPGPADQRNQAPLRHPERSIYRCFLTDLAGFTDICRVGPDYADRQDRKKTGLFHSHTFTVEQPYSTPLVGNCQADPCANTGSLYVYAILVTQDPVV